MDGRRARVFRSDSFDPFENLATEDLLFRTAPAERTTLFLWINDPVVVVGRYQNPWLECRLDEMERCGVAFARRQSGGGAVYHDRGNLCVTFMGPRRGFDREANIALVMEALGDLGIATETNDRNDILMGGRKVSGSAYRETADRAFHHLTLLIGADLGALSRFLKPAGRISRAKGVASVRSPVANLAEAAPDLTPAAASEAVARRFAPEARTEASVADGGLDPEELRRTAERWKSWDWRFGGSPDFSLSLGGGPGDGHFDLELEILKGTVTTAREGDISFDELVGARFSFPELEARLRSRAERLEAEGDWEGAERSSRYAREAGRL